MHRHTNIVIGLTLLSFAGAFAASLIQIFFPDAHGDFLTGFYHTCSGGFVGGLTVLLGLRLGAS